MSIFHNCVDLDQLADAIAKQFTPLAFNCKCNGEDPDCAWAMESPTVWSQFETTTRIADFVRGFKNDAEL